MKNNLFLLGASMSLGLQEVYELGLLGDGSLHFHLLMRVSSLQVELSEHHYCHEFLLKYLTSHREGDRETEIWGGMPLGKTKCFLGVGVSHSRVVKNREQRKQTGLGRTRGWTPSSGSDCACVCLCEDIFVQKHLDVFQLVFQIGPLSLE